MKIYKYILLALCALPLSCAKEEGRKQASDLEGLRTVSVPLVLNVLDEEAGYDDSPSTKVPEGTASTKAEPVIGHFWFIQYDQDGNILGNPVYHAASDKVTVFLPDRGSSFKCIVIASTQGISDALFTQENCRTLDLLYSMGYELTQDDIIRPEDEQDLYLYGSLDITSSTDQPDYVFNLRRNVTRLSFTVENSCPVPDFEIHSVKVCNAPTRYHYFVNDKPQTYTDYEIVLSDPVSPSELSELFSFYIPRNLKGTPDAASGATEKTKNNFAPENATYIELYAVQGLYRYKFIFYPGEDMEKNFDLEANCYYNLSIEIISYFSKTDSRITQLPMSS